MVDLQEFLSALKEEFFNKKNSISEYDIEDTGHEADKAGYGKKTCVVSRQEPSKV